MKFKSFFIRGLFVASFLILSGFISMVNSQNIDYRKVSLSVRGGATFGNEGNGFNLLDSRFNTFTETSGIIGLGIQYALTPAWSLEGGYTYTKIRGRSGRFETNMNIISLKNIFNLNQILFTNRISNSINPYISAGIGYDIYKYKSQSETVDNNSLSYNLGAGITFKLSNAIDLFTHYEYHIASNEVDNVIGGNNGLGADVLTNLAGGIRINFGKKGTTHPSWRPVPVEVRPSEYEHLVSEEKRAKEFEQQLAELEKEFDQQEREHEKQIEAYTETIDRLKQKVSGLEQQLQETRDSLAAISLNPETENASGSAESIPAGHYVQVFATLGLQSAQNVRSHAISQLQDLLDNPSEDVFIAKRKQFYEVLIGTFNDFQKAGNVLQDMKDHHEDAFIITFPRPLSLQELYNGINKVN